MSYEINIISINQKKPICLKERNGILLHNETENYEVHRYAKIWPFFSNVEGILYSIIKKCGEDSYSAYELCDSNFDAVAPTEELLGWISEEVKENLTPLVLKDEGRDDVIYFIQKILENSPEKRILFQTRYEWGDKEIILGTLNIKQFVDMLKNNKVFFNVCYIVEADV
ncbi:MAG: hypothetical protein HFH23_18350 [Ruminococcus sp.]|nr:hypothetical protein [Ruminococcus sp.]